MGGNTMKVREEFCAAVQGGEYVFDSYIKAICK